jgi:hypothetical protein
MTPKESSIVKISAIVCVIILLCLPLSATAHGTGVHVVGTVTAVSSDRLDVTAPNGTLVSVRTTQKTRYRAKNAAADTPQVGDRVVIEAAQDGDALTAVEVKFASSGRGAHPAP